MRIGICGGTFDPFHLGHLAPVLSVRETMEWDRVLYIPAHRQPFKQNHEATSAYHRFAMAVLGTEEQDDFYVSPLELERGAISYTVDTLTSLRAIHPTATLDWIIGDDNLETLHEWKSIATIFSLANFVVLTRHDVSRAAEIAGALPCSLSEPATRPAQGAMALARNPTVPISATEIRRKVRAGEPVDDLAGARISRYIQHYGLYRKGQT